MITRVLIISVCSFLVFSCVPPKRTKYYTRKVVTAKTVDIVNGSTRYNVAFVGGDSHDLTFGLYTKYNVGDTIHFVKEDGWDWKVTTKKQYYEQTKK